MFVYIEEVPQLEVGGRRGPATHLYVYVCLYKVQVKVALSPSTGLEEKYGDLAEVEVDEMLRLVRHVAAEVTSDDTMPRWVVLLVKLLLDVRSNVLEQQRHLLNDLL